MELIHKYDIDTQEELAARLNEAGFKVTQATVSRDIRALKMTKVTGKNGKSHYAILKEAPHALEDKYAGVEGRPGLHGCRTESAGHSDGAWHGDGRSSGAGRTELAGDPGMHCGRRHHYVRSQDAGAGGACDGKAERNRGVMSRIFREEAC